jgi:hypothetical protein
MLVDIRAAVDDALSGGASKAKSPASAKAAGAAASGAARGFSAKPATAQEFEVSADPTHDADQSGEN